MTTKDTTDGGASDLDAAVKRIWESIDQNPNLQRLIASRIAPLIRAELTAYGEQQRREGQRRVNLIAEAMQTLIDSDEYLIHARTECDCYAHNGARKALAEAKREVTT